MLDSFFPSSFFILCGVWGPKEPSAQSYRAAQQGNLPAGEKHTTTDHPSTQATGFFLFYYWTFYSGLIGFVSNKVTATYMLHLHRCFTCCTWLDVLSGPCGRPPTLLNSLLLRSCFGFLLHFSNYNQNIWPYGVDLHLKPPFLPDLA